MWPERLMKEKSLGPIGNSIAGLCRRRNWRDDFANCHGIGGDRRRGMDMQSILANVGGGGVGGAILMAIIGIIKSQKAKPGS